MHSHFTYTNTFLYAVIYNTAFTFEIQQVLDSK